MDYKKKYNDAQKWIESIYSELSHEHQMEAEEFFPELKESEDEKIRKRIIQALHGDVLDMEETTKAIAWLEKQGEPFDDNIITREDEILQAISIGLTDAKEDLGWSDFGGLPIEEIQDWLEKQGEQGKIEALRTEYEKGRADVLRCIDPDEMVADFCSQPFSKTRSIASVYRQGIIDIIKRINNNEKTSIIGTRSIDDGGVY